MSKICINENCNEKARFGLVNPETGMFEKHHCKNHKLNGEKGNPPKWELRYPEILEICKNRNIILLDSEQEYIEKTKKYGENTFLIFKCLECNTIIDTTTLHAFKQNRLGCLCNKNIPYYKKYPQFLEICLARNVTLLDSKEEYIKKTKKDSHFAKIKLQCNICLYIVESTNINNFINKNRLGCNCCKNIPWYKRPKEFLDICKEKNVILLDSELEYIDKTKKNGNNAFLNLQCVECNAIVTTTNMSSFINGSLACSCNKKKSEECLGKLLEEIFPDNKFIKIRPDWIKNKEGNNLELDFYCEYLKLAFEYQGIQHEEYNKFYHRGDINNFYKQQEHDRIKKEICEKKGIKLICVPSKYDYTNPLEMCEYILEQLN